MASSRRYSVSIGDFKSFVGLAGSLSCMLLGVGAFAGEATGFLLGAVARRSLVSRLTTALPSFPLSWRELIDEAEQALDVAFDDAEDVRGDTIDTALFVLVHSDERADVVVCLTSFRPSPSVSEATSEEESSSMDAAGGSCR